MRSNIIGFPTTAAMTPIARHLSKPMALFNIVTSSAARSRRCIPMGEGKRGSERELLSTSLTSPVDDLLSFDLHTLSPDTTVPSLVVY